MLTKLTVIQGNRREIELAVKKTSKTLYCYLFGFFYHTVSHTYKTHTIQLHKSMCWSQTKDPAKVVSYFHE